MFIIINFISIRIMVLTGKALEDFKNYILYELGIQNEILLYRKTLINALIMDWFDSLCASKLGGYNASDYLFEHLRRNNYKDSIQLTIKRLNNIYNEQEK